jgi:hypothetical protein
MAINFLQDKPNNDFKPVVGDDFKNPKVLEVNLLKDEVAVRFDWNGHLLSLLLMAMVAGAFVAEIYLGLSWWQNSENTKAVQLEAQYQQTKLEFDNMKSQSDTVTAFRAKLAAAKQLLDNHIYWSNFFNWLEKDTLSSINYAGFTGDISGTYSLSATAKSFSDISWQTKVFAADPNVNGVTVDSGTLVGKVDKVTGKISTPTVSFDLKLLVKPSIFKK